MWLRPDCLFHFPEISICEIQVEHLVGLLNSIYLAKKQLLTCCSITKYEQCCDLWKFCTCELTIPLCFKNSRFWISQVPHLLPFLKWQLSFYENPFNSNQIKAKFSVKMVFEPPFEPRYPQKVVIPPGTLNPDQNTILDIPFQDDDVYVASKPR